MKNQLLILFAIFLSLIATAQEEENTYQEDAPVNLKQINDRKHEFRIDVLEGLAIPSLDISYEYVLSKYSGFGVSASVNLEGSDNLIDQKFAITPYFRQYFFNKKDYGARGFFAEGLLQLGTGDSFNNVVVSPNGNVSQTSDNWTKLGIGFTIGQKWVSRNGFVLELTGGGGRYFGDDEFSPGGFFRGGVNVGYRF